MDKEIITRTSGKRLGYIDDLYVDPVSLEVTSLYLRKKRVVPDVSGFVRVWQGSCIIVKV